MHAAAADTSTTIGIARGLTSALTDEDASVGVAALETFADKWNSGDPQFWKKIQNDVVSIEHDTIRSFLERNYPTSASRLNRVASKIPGVADELESLFAAPGNLGPGPGLLTYDVLRNTSSLTPAGQQLLLESRSDRPKVAAYALAEPDRFEGVESQIYALASSPDPADAAFGIEFAATRRPALPDDVLRRALVSNAPDLVRSAANYIQHRTPELARRLDAELRRAFQDQADDKAWAALLGARTLIDPEAGYEALVEAGGIAGLRSFDRQAGALLASASSSRADELFLSQSEAIWGDAAVCDLKVVGLEFLASRLRRGNAPQRVRQAAVDATVIVLSRPDCNPGAVSRSLDALSGVGIFGDATEVERFVADVTQAGVTINASSGDRIGAAHLACRRLRPAAPRLARRVERELRLVAAGIANCVGPSDPEADELLTAVLETVSRADGATALPIASALQHLGALTERQANELYQATLSPGIDPQVALTLVSILASAARTKESLTVVDRLLEQNEHQRAVELMELLLQAGVDPTAVVTDSRAGILILAMQGDPATRAAATRVLAKRPDAVRPQDAAASLFALARGGTPLAATDCLDYAATQPSGSLRFGLVVLVASSAPYQSDTFALPICAHFLSPFDETRDVFTTLASPHRERFLDGNRAIRQERLLELDHIWSAATRLPDEQAAYKEAYSVIIEQADRLAASAPWSLSGIEQLANWQKRAEVKFKDRKTGFAFEAWERRGAFGAGAVPGVLLCQLLLWGGLLAAYPHSRAVQSFVFYNPLIRKLLALGYMDMVLLCSARIRRRIYQPLQPGLLGELGKVGPQDTPIEAYYGNSGVVQVPLSGMDKAIAKTEADALAGHLTADGAVSERLAAWKGRVLLVGPSGRGKTSFLRHWLLSSEMHRLPFAYLTAGECGKGVLAGLSTRLGEFGRDVDLAASLVRAGRFDVYIDGVNEVDAVVRTEILDFVADNPGANILLASQQLGVGLPAVEAWYLLPLSPTEMVEFVESRERFLDADAPLRGEPFRVMARAFLEALHPDAGRSSLTDVDSVRYSFYATLANPMDLQTASELLALGVEPDPFNLQRQQFDIVDRLWRERTGSSFPADRFGISILRSRLEGGPEIDATAFPDETRLLLERKQILSRSPPGGQTDKTTYQFRHEKIRDFYMHFAFLGDNGEVRRAYARDDRFAGVYDHLAKVLPQGQAEELREYLLMTAVDSQDHRVSDRFIQHLRWRKLLDESDPSWILDLDPPSIREALGEFRRLDGDRSNVERRLSELRDVVDRGRSVARIATATEPAALADRTAVVLAQLGATAKQAAAPWAKVLTLPTGVAVELWALASPGQPSKTVLAAIESLMAEIPKGSIVLLLNVDAEREPGSRDWSSAVAWATEHLDGSVRVLTALQLLQAVREAENVGDASRLWATLEGREPAHARM
jgi:hypothetical protein